MNKLNLAFNEFPKLSTNRFLLRQVEERDYKDIYEIYADEEAVRYQQIKPMETMEQAQKAVSAFLKGFKNREFIRWCIVDNECDKVLGLINLHDFDNWNSKVEIGCMLNKKYWEQGIMSETAQKVINYAFEVIELNRIEALIDPKNIASIKLIAKLGFEKEGLKRNAEYCSRTDEYEDRQIFGLVKSNSYMKKL